MQSSRFMIKWQQPCPIADEKTGPRFKIGALDEKSIQSDSMGVVIESGLRLIMDGSRFVWHKEDRTIEAYQARSMSYKRGLHEQIYDDFEKHGTYEKRVQDRTDEQHPIATPDHGLKWAQLVERLNTDLGFNFDANLQAYFKSMVFEIFDLWLRKYTHFNKEHHHSTDQTEIDFDCRENYIRHRFHIPQPDNSEQTPTDLQFRSGEFMSQSQKKNAKQKQKQKQKKKDLAEKAAKRQVAPRSQSPHQPANIPNPAAPPHEPRARSNPHRRSNVSESSVRRRSPASGPTGVSGSEFAGQGSTSLRDPGLSGPDLATAKVRRDTTPVLPKAGRPKLPVPGNLVDSSSRLIKGLEGLSLLSPKKMLGTDKVQRQSPPVDATQPVPQPNPAPVKPSKKPLGERRAEFFGLMHAEAQRLKSFPRTLAVLQSRHDTRPKKRNENTNVREQS